MAESVSPAPRRQADEATCLDSALRRKYLAFCREHPEAEECALPPRRQEGPQAEWQGRID